MRRAVIMVSIVYTKRSLWDLSSLQVICPVAILVSVGGHLDLRRDVVVHGRHDGKSIVKGRVG